MRSKLALAVLAITIAGCSSPPKPAPKGEPKPVAKKPPPERFTVRFETSKGPVVMETIREWSPRGADRFYELVQDKFFDEAYFFRMLPKFVVQFGVHRDPKVTELWRQLRIPDDPVKQSNKRGTVTYATDGVNTRTTQIFINLGDNARLDARGFSPFGRVTEGMEIVDSFYKGYGEVIPRGSGPDPAKMENQGNEYVERNYPKLDFIKTARVVD